MKISQALLHAFLVQWRAYYRSQPAREYDPEWIWEMFRIYFKFCEKVLGSTHDLIVHNDRQWEAYHTAISKPESMWHRSRRSGKTLGLSHLAVFFAELGFGPCKGKVVYRCPHINQLKGLRQWLRYNPFYLKTRRTEYEVDLFECANPLDIACISPATNTGLECSVLLEDEYSTIKKEELLYDWMMDTRAFLAKGRTEYKRHIHASSGRRNSPFEDDYLYLLNHDPTAYHIMPYVECPWITEEYIAKERMKYLDAPYWVEEQYECRWVSASGNFFDQSKLHVITDSNNLFTKLRLIPNVAGLDWNGDTVGHILGVGYWDNVDIYIMHEQRFNTVKEVKEWIDTHLGITVEVEGQPKQMGYNAGFSDHLASLGAQCSYQNWSDTDDNIKDRRLALLQRAQVYVHETCRWFVKNFIEATYDPKQLLPKLLKRPDQHGLDYCLHMLHGGGTLDIVSPAYLPQPVNPWESPIDLIQHKSRV